MRPALEGYQPLDNRNRNQPKVGCQAIGLTLTLTHKTFGFVSALRESALRESSARVRQSLKTDNYVIATKAGRSLLQS
jgi:hypothetical protein